MGPEPVSVCPNRATVQQVRDAGNSDFGVRTVEVLEHSLGDRPLSPSFSTRGTNEVAPYLAITQIGTAR